MMRNKKPQAPEPASKRHFSLNLSFFKDQRFRIIVGLLVALFGVFLFIAFAGFLFTGRADQSLIDLKLSEIIINPNITSSNPDGFVGAWLSDLLINRGFGIASFIICYVLVIGGFRFAGRKIKNFQTKIILSLCLMLWFSLFFGFFSDIICSLFNSQVSYLYPGGAHGYFVIRWTESLIGGVGTFFLLVVTGVTILFFGFESTFYKLMAYLKHLVEIYKEARAERAARRAAEEAANVPISSVANGVGLVDVDENGTENIEEVTDIQDIDDEEGVEVHNDTEAEEYSQLPEEPKDENEIPENSVDVDEALEEGESDISQMEEKKEEVNTSELKPIPFTIAQPKTHQEESQVLVDIDDDLDSDNDTIDLTIEEGEKEKMLRHNLGSLDDYDPTLELSNFHNPPLELLKEYKSDVPDVTPEELEANKDRIVETLRDFKIEISEIKATIGPTVTLYEIVPAPGVRISKIKNLEDDIALSLAALGIRIIAPIPGAGTIGIEVPNQHPKVVSMREIISSEKFQKSKYALPVAIGRTISNETYTFDLAKMPHLLVAGATGQGKSVGLNAIITSLLYKKHPSQLKFVMVDPKKVELSIYSVIEKHYLAKLPEEENAIITDVDKVVNTLNSLCVEMDSRYDLLKAAQVRNIKEYNEKFVKRQLNPENGHRYLPYIVVIVDEYADLIMTAGKDIETPIARIAQLARAVGLHMIIATQRPSANVITGIIKANFPARIAFKVASMIDSRTILDASGANQLIGRGDMLMSVNSETTRIQCAFVDTPEVSDIVNFIAKQQSYGCAMELPEPKDRSNVGGGNDDDGPTGSARDPLFEEAARLVIHSQLGSTSSIQRRFSLGYNRAGRIMDQLEKYGIVGPNEGSKARQVLISDEYALEQVLRGLDENGN